MAYRYLEHTSPSRVVLFGVGHLMMSGLFCMTVKDFKTPVGFFKNDRGIVERLQEVGRSIISRDDFAHRAGHSLESQVIFLQHLLPENSFTIIPIFCGPLIPSLSGYSRSACMETAGPFLKALSNLLSHGDHDTLVVAGVDFSHIGPKFGHNMPATHLQSQSEMHDKNLLEAFSNMQKGQFWEESVRVKDQFNVCGFSAMACLMEILPPSRGQVLGYEVWHEQPTRSAVGFTTMKETQK
jgi:AmmeMemoRadiSam system protein B